MSAVNNKNYVPERVIFLSFGVGVLAVLTNGIYLLFKMVTAGSDNGFYFLLHERIFVLFYVNILTGFLYIYLGYSLFSKKLWAINLYRRIKYLVLIPVFFVVYVVDPLLIKYGFGPVLF